MPVQILSQNQDEARLTYPRSCECGEVKALTRLSHACIVIIHSRTSSHRQRAVAVDRLCELRIKRREHECPPPRRLDCTTILERLFDQEVGHG